MAREDEDRGLRIVPGGRQHCGAIAEFIREVWNPAATDASVAESWDTAAARNPVDPGLPPPTWIALRSGKVIGYVTTIPSRWWDGRQEHPGYWLKGLMVLPEHRNGPIGYSLLKAASAHLPRSGGLAVAAPARRLFTALGYTDHGALPNWIRPLRGGRILAKLRPGEDGLPSGPRWAVSLAAVAQRTGLAFPAGWVGGQLLRVTALAARASSAGLSASRLDAIPEAGDLDQLWVRAREGIRCGGVRDHQYLAHRYPVTPVTPYRWLGVFRSGRLAGVAILRIPGEDATSRLAGLRVATIVDILYHPRERNVGLALLGGVERLARTVTADAILASSSASALAGLLRRQCYFPLPGTVHLLFRDATRPRPDWPAQMHGWWMTRGDGLADEAL